jgi:hypothetical protein
MCPGRGTAASNPALHRAHREMHWARQPPLDARRLERAPVTAPRAAPVSFKTLCDTRSLQEVAIKDHPYRRVNLGV